jgi:hypothetical protein
MLEAETAKQKEILKIQHQNDIAKLNQQLANEKAALKYQSDLAKQSSGGVRISGGGSSGGSYSSSSYNKKLTNDEKKLHGSTYAVNTAYYQGSKNADAAKYGTFSNGYQPKGISGHGTLSKVKGDSITLKTQTLSGQKQTVVQNVWKASDGTKWYWEGRQNKYIQIK